MDAKTMAVQLLDKTIEESVQAHLQALEALCPPEKIRECDEELAAFRKSADDEIKKVDAEYNLRELNRKEIAHTLTDEEADRLAEGRKVRSMVYKTKTAEVKKYVNEIMYNPFRKLYDIGFRISEEKLNHPEDSMETIFDRLEFPETDKIMALCYIREYAIHCGIPSSQLKRSSKEAQDPAEKALRQQIVDFGSRFGVGKGVEKDGALIIQDGPFSELNNGLFTSISRGFAPIGKDEHKANVVEISYRNMIDFCNKALRSIHIKKLKAAETVENDPYFSAGSTAYQKALQDLEELRNSHDVEKAFQKTGLSFGRDGSEFFKKMKNAYQALNRQLEEHMQHPTPESFQKLRVLSVDLKRKTKSYLNYKRDQIRQGEIDFTFQTMPDGRRKPIADNPRTRNRMEFAEKLLDRIETLNEYVARGTENNPPAAQNEVQI